MIKVTSLSIGDVVLYAGNVRRVTGFRDCVDPRFRLVRWSPTRINYLRVEEYLPTIEEVSYG